MARQGNTRRSLGFDPFEGDSGDRRQAAAEAVRGKEGAAAAAKEELGGPAQPPPVRMRMDLPVKAQEGTAKGSFFAEDAYWDGLGLLPDIIAALKQLGFKRPSHIQAGALKAWRSGEAQHLALADQAGSGKTLAYLLPLFQVLKAEDMLRGSPATQAGSPRAVVLLPTVELVQQVYRVAKALSKAGARLRVAAMTGGQDSEAQRYKSLRTQRDTLAVGVDLVVATPGRLAEHMRHRSLDFSCCKAIVLDEVDVLLGENRAFEDQVSPLKDVAPPSMRFVMVTATLPQHTALALRSQFRDIQLVTGPGLHRTAAGLSEELIDCSGGDEVSLASGVARKIEAMQRALKRHAAPRALVFCNKIESARAVENALRRVYSPNELQVLVYHEAIREDVRQASMNAFLTPIGQEDSALQQLQAATQFDPWAAHKAIEEAAAKEAQQQNEGKGKEKGGEDQDPQVALMEEREEEKEEGLRGGEAEEQKGEGAARGSSRGPRRMVLIATDRMSRGIDCMDCEHVVLFDFPRDPSEYVRRVGRTARGASGRGTVSCLVLGREVALAKEIMKRNEKGQPIHRLPEM